MLIYVKIMKKKKFLRTDRQTDGQPKTIVRNLTTQKTTQLACFLKLPDNFFFCLSRNRSINKEYDKMIYKYRVSTIKLHTLNVNKI